MEKSGFTVSESATVDAPIINELPFALECALDHIDEESGCVYGNIKNIVADEAILDGDGTIDLKKLNPISYDPANAVVISVWGRRSALRFMTERH